MSTTSSSTTILADLPAERDALDFAPYVETLAEIIASPNTRTPLTIGVFGTWGSGKSSLMRMVRRQLPDGFQVAWFDAWKYDKEETLWRALLLQTLASLRKGVPKTQKKAHTELDDLETALYQAVDREEVGGVTIDWGKLTAGVAQGAVQIGLSFIPGASMLTAMVEALQKEGATTASKQLVESIHREHSKIHIRQVQYLEEFHKRFSELVNKYVRRTEETEGVEEGRLVVFVDDLDRCLPEKAVEVLEAIKLFVDAPGCVFVLGLDPDVIARGIEIKYHEFGLAAQGDDDHQRFVIDGTRYLEKIIQLPFHIPPIDRDDMATFVHGLVDAWPHAECPNVFAEGLGDNPRQVKRTVNVFLLLWQLAQKREEKLQGQIKPIRLAKVVAIQHVYTALYEVLKATPRLLRELEDYYRATASTEEREAATGKEGRGEAARAEPPPALAPYVHRAAVRSLLTLQHPPDTQDATFRNENYDQNRGDIGHDCLSHCRNVCHER